MANELLAGRARLGWFFDDDPATPQTATLLEDTGNALTLTLPWINERPTGQYERWFHGTTTRFGDDPDRTKYRYEVPELLHFRDVDGPVALVGCRGAGMQSNSAYGQGRGVIRITFAVLGGGGCDYTRINGMRTQVPSLGEWVGLRSIDSSYSLTDDQRLRSLDLHLESPDPVRLDRRLNLQLRPSFFSRPAADDITEIGEPLQVETRARDARPWTEHLALHNTVRDLVDVASWRPSGTSGIWALRDDDPERALSGRAVGDRWSPVRSYVVREHQPRTRSQFLFGFNDLGAAGFRRWARLRQEYARGLDPILAYFDHPAMPAEALLLQTNIGFEAIGYHLALESGASRHLAGGEGHQPRLLRIAAQLPLSPPFDTKEWATQATAAYNGVKHANRTMPDPSVVYQTLIQSWVVLRLWVAAKIGVPTAALERTTKIDHLWRQASSSSVG